MPILGDEETDRDAHHRLIRGFHGFPVRAIVPRPWLSHRVDDSLEFQWNPLENSRLRSLVKRGEIAEKC